VPITRIENLGARNTALNRSNRGPGNGSPKKSWGIRPSFSHCITAPALVDPAALVFRRLGTDLEEIAMKVAAISGWKNAARVAVVPRRSHDERHQRR
jgi:hypothetical protein